MASTAHTTRRSLFAIAAGAALLPAVPALAAGDAAQFRYWARQASDAWDRANDPAGSDAHTRRWCMAANDAEIRIAETVPQSPEAVSIKLATLAKIARENGDDTLALGIAQCRAFIEGRH